MTRKLLIITMMWVCMMPAMAQRGLHVNELFEGHIVNHDRMVETQVRGKAVAKYGLTYFRSLRFKAKKAEAKKIEGLIMEDADQQTITKLNRLGNLLTNLIVQLPPKGNTQRLLCYKYDMPDVLIIYMEGSSAVPETLGKMLK